MHASCAFRRVASLALAVASCSGNASAAESVPVPWRAGNVDSFQLGTVEEGRISAHQGSLPVTVHRPAGAGVVPFVVLLHGCGGLKREAMWARWVRPWTDLLLENGVGTAVVDSFQPRSVDQVCTSRDIAAWARRRADDAYSVAAWLKEQPYVDAKRIAVMGMSNGGRSVLAALRTTLKHPHPFVAGIALYPGCQSDVRSVFYAPLLLLIGKGDSTTPARFCEQMAAAQPADARELKLIVYANAPHTFDMQLPDRTVLGMRLGYDAEAYVDARRQVIDFLAAHGLTSDRRKR